MKIPIKQLTYEHGVEQIFKLIVPEGNHMGEYVFNMPEGWEEVDSIVNMNETYFNVEDFIIGSEIKLKISEYTNKQAFELIRNVYRDEGGDGRIIFKWIAKKNEVEYDLLGENFEINLNKKKESFDRMMMTCEIELIKSEAQNKFINRQETTIDLFSNKDLDNEDIIPATAKTIGYKRGEASATNYYIYNTSQISYNETAASKKFLAFTRSTDFEFGSNQNENCGMRYYIDPVRQEDLGPFLEAAVTYSLKATITNLDINCRTSGGNIYPNVSIYAEFRQNGIFVKNKKIKTYTENLQGSIRYSKLSIDNEEFDIGSIQPGQSLHFYVIDDNSGDFLMYNLNDDLMIKLTTNIEPPLVRTKGIKIIDALNQIVKSSTSSQMSATSFYIGEGGVFNNTSIATGMYLRGLPEVYLSNKLKTNFKDLFQEGIANIIPMGYDILDDKVIFEDLEYFFKDVQSYDLSNKEFLTEDFSITNDEDLSYNTLLFGSKKISTKSQNDIKNFVTTSEITTSIKSKKNKFDKQTNLIIDEYKIQELVDDKSSSTGENDDDLVMVDLVNVDTIQDQGVFKDCEHIVKNGHLVLKCLKLPFDLTMIEIGSSIKITEGKNVGTWTVLGIDLSEMMLNKILNIETGNVDTFISYTALNVTKNRTDEGFTESENIRNLRLATNVRHNPKYHEFRWFPWFGSGLRKKHGTDILKNTNYKNNSSASVKIVNPEMPNELQGKIVTGADESLQRFRDQSTTLFTGERIEITMAQVSFEEYIDLYSNWKFGENDDRTKSRGFVTCPTPYGLYDVYPFGQEMLKHSKSENTLTIKGKIKGKYVENPILKTVNQIDKNTISLSWDYVDDYVNPIVKIQYSLDGINWETVHEVTNMKSTTFSNIVFDGVFTGEIVHFRIIVSTADYYNKVSNSSNIDWKFNNWVLKETSRTENTSCGNSYLNLEVKGTVNLEITWDYQDYPGTGAYTAFSSQSPDPIASFFSPIGSGESDQQITNHSLNNETVTFGIFLNNATTSDFPEQRPLNCSSGNYSIPVSAFLSLSIKDVSTNDVRIITLNADTIKKYFYRPIQTGPGGPETGLDPQV
ncbi:hypothetical protein [Chryseobacterium sp.]|uniref:hypothetical protein n=1 Tax=Chryseobacterium sp. TaxID=1871047 RepID=UPI002898B2E0|nr:hypothetical protein [Chryseobacterium sp.]